MYGRAGKSNVWRMFIAEAACISNRNRGRIWAAMCRCALNTNRDLIMKKTVSHARHDNRRRLAEAACRARCAYYVGGRGAEGDDVLTRGAGAARRTSGGVGG